MNKPILVIGSEGLVGSRFVEISQHREKFHSPRRIEFDMTDASQVNAIFKSFEFSAVVNFAAFTDTDAAEREREDKNGACWVTNVEAVANVAQAIVNNGKKTHFIHISTDMVFYGDKNDKGPFEENHDQGKELDRMTWYGYTKAEGERTLRNILGQDATILRIIYPVRAKYDEKLDYLRKPLSLFDKGKLYPLFNNQQISISFIDEVAAALDRIISAGKYGNYHAGSNDTTTPFELVSYMLEKARGVKNAVEPQKIEDFIESVNSPTYRYPKYGGLKVEKTEQELGLKFSTWKETVDKLTEQGLGKTTS